MVLGPLETCTLFEVFMQQLFLAVAGSRSNPIVLMTSYIRSWPGRRRGLANRACVRNKEGGIAESDNGYGNEIEEVRT